LSPYCKTHGACSRRAHQKGTHARIIPSRASSLGGPCPRLYHCHTHVQSFGFGAVVSLACILPSFFLRRRTARETGNIPRRAPFNPVGEHVQSSTRPLPSFPSHPLRPIASSRTYRNSRGTLLPSSAHHTRAVQGERGVRTRHSHLLTAPPPYLTLDGSASRVNKGARLR
jgi:hypothetical protein